MKKIISLSLQIIAFKLAVKLKSKQVLKIRLNKMTMEQVENIRNYLFFISLPSQCLEPHEQEGLPDYSNACKDLAMAVRQLNEHLYFQNAKPFRMWVNRRIRIALRMFF